MKNEDENAEVKPDGQPAESAKAAKPAKPPKPAKPKKEKKPKPSGGVRLPFLLEFTYTISTLVLIFLAFAVIITSFLAGANIFIVVLRTVVAVIVVGGLLMLISSQISSGLLFAAKIEQEEAVKKLNETPEEPIPSILDPEQDKAEAL